MRIGITYFPTAYSMAPNEVAAAVEERGFESLWFPEHSHIPVDRSPWPGGDELPRHYYEVLDPMVAMAAAAVATSTLRLGTAVALVVQRDPIQLAKTLASLDVISVGRVELGVGGGWNLAEMRNHGTDPETRFALLRERVEAMKAIWTQERAEYHGRYVDFEPLISLPKPVQRPHIPIHVAGAAPGAMRRAIRYGDGWLPLAGRGESDFGRLTGVLREQAAEAGRDPSSLQVTVCFAPTDSAALESYREGGVDRIVLPLPSADRDTTLAALDAHTALAASLGGS